LPPHGLVVIHDLVCHFDGPTDSLETTAKKSNPDSDPVLESPFLNMSYSQIKSTLEEVVNTTESKLQTDWFLVLDDRSEETQSAVMVNTGDMGVRSLRAEYSVSWKYLSAVIVAHPPIDELAQDVGWDGIVTDRW
jgi:hypothetical protein